MERAEFERLYAQSDKSTKLILLLEQLIEESDQPKPDYGKCHKCGGEIVFDWCWNWRCSKCE